MDERHQGDTGLPLECMARSDRDKENDGAAECSPGGKIHHTPPTSALSPSQSDDSTETESRFTEQEPHENDSDIGRGDGPTSPPHTNAPSGTNDVDNKSTLSDMFNDFALPIFSIVTYLFDVGSDIWLAVSYAWSDNWWWSGLTLAFAVAAGLVLALASRGGSENHDPPGLNPTLQRIASIVAMCTLTLPVIKYSEILVMAYRKYKHVQDKKESSQEILKKESRTSVLRLYEVFIEAAPQLILQLYIMMRITVNISLDNVNSLAQVASIATSLVSITWALVSRRRLSRLSEGQKTMSIPGLVMDWLWHFFVIVARVIALAVFAAQFQIWLLTILAIHWVAIIIIVELSKQRRAHCPKMLTATILSLATNTLCPYELDTKTYELNTKTRSRLRYATFHCIMYTENILMVVLWYTATYSHDLWYRIPCMVIILLGHIVGVIIQIIFYLRFHPKYKDITCCVPWHELQFSASDSHQDTERLEQQADP